MVDEIPNERFLDLERMAETKGVQRNKPPDWFKDLFPPIDSDQKLQRVIDSCINDLWKTSDEELMNEVKEEGDVEGYIDEVEEVFRNASRDRKD